MSYTTGTPITINYVINISCDTKVTFIDAFLFLSHGQSKYEGKAVSTSSVRKIVRSISCFVNYMLLDLRGHFLIKNLKLYNKISDNQMHCAMSSLVALVMIGYEF